MLVALSGCATPDAPQPPSLRIPSPVTDLRATRTGDRVTLSWTAPAQTTDDENIKRPGTIRVCRDVEAATACTPIVSDIPALVGKAQQYTDTLSAEQMQHTTVLVYHVQALNPAGRADQASNPATVPIGPTLPAPAALRLESTRSGVIVHWRGAAAPKTADLDFSYRILRRDAGSANWAALATIPAADGDLAYSDTTPVFGHDYDYAALGISHFSRTGKDYEVEGDAAAPQTIAFRDVFPPGAPAGLQAVYAGVPGQDAIDLSWNPEQERELAGYNVYRHEQGGNPSRLNSELLPGTSYHDSHVLPGRKYFYSITAVDAHGVESKPSEEASESVPAVQK